MSLYEQKKKQLDEWQKEHNKALPSHITPVVYIFKESRPECCVKGCRRLVSAEYDEEDGYKTKLLWASDMCPKHHRKREMRVVRDNKEDRESG